MLCWKRIYEGMSNASNTAGKPTAVSAQLQAFYKAHLLAYQLAHPEDVSELLCPFCGKNEPPAAAAIPNPRWNMVWTACATAACGTWLHRACAKAEGTVKRPRMASPGAAADGASELRVLCPACLLEFDAEAEPVTLERRKSDEQAAAANAKAAARCARVPPPVAGGPRYVQLLPARPNMSGRVFNTHQARCVPLLDSAERCDELLRAARDVLCASGLTAELVASSLGFARDDMDVNFKTVALLVSGNAVLSALVFCEDAHGNAAQVLVAGTSPQARRSGCMRQLLRESADWLAAKGVNTVCVGTTRANTAAAAVYVKLGFAPSPSGWPAGMVPKRTSSDLRDVWVLCRGQAAAAAGGDKRVDITPDKGDSARRARASEDAALELPLAGPPPEWPDEVPFTSGCVWAGQPPELWPQVPCHDVVVRLITSPAHPCCGAYGLFARRDLLPTGDLLAYGGACRAACDSESLFLADCGGGCDVDAERCGNEARYLNDYFGIAPQANAVLESREAHLTGCRYVVVRLIVPVREGEELLLDYGVDYPRHRFAKPKRRRLVE